MKTLLIFFKTIDCLNVTILLYFAGIDLLKVALGLAMV